MKKHSTNISSNKRRIYVTLEGNNSEKEGFIMNAIIYARVSTTKEAQETSLLRQKMNYCI